MSKKIINDMKLRLPAKSENEAVCRAVISAFTAVANPTTEELCDIRCAISEVFTNCIVHAYKDIEDKSGCYIYVSVRLYDTREITIEISDNGCGIADVDAARKPFFTTGEPSERCGMGFTVADSFMDYVKVKSKVGKGTTVLMGKALS